MKPVPQLMWQATDPVGIEVTCHYWPERGEFEVSVWAGDAPKRSQKFPQSFTPTFGMDVVDHQQALAIADLLATQIDNLRKQENPMKTALIIVDVQKDFCPGGALAVAEGDEVVPLINQLLNTHRYDLVVSTQDYHPRNHKSFAANNPGTHVGQLGTLGGKPQVMWPNHCVQGTPGADFHPDLAVARIHRNFPKGLNPEIDSYSGFYDNDHQQSTGLSEFLKAEGITAVEVVGLALDYCVKATALDAVAAGFKTTVLAQATRAVNLKPTDGADSIQELTAAGVAVK